MISNYNNYTINGKGVKIREISFNELKNLSKKLLTDDLKELDGVFEEVLEQATVDTTLNVFEKFYALIIIRNLIHGNDFNFNYNDTKVTTNLSQIIEKIEFNIDDIVIETANITFVFGTPKKLYHSSIDEIITDCLKKVILHSGEHDCSNFSYDEKFQLINESNLHIVDTYQKIMKVLASKDLVFFKDLKIIVPDNSTLLLLKRLFAEDISAIYNFEYTCIRNLNLGAVDMEYYTYPELKIFIQHLTKELNEKKADSKPSLDS